MENRTPSSKDAMLDRFNKRYAPEVVGAIDQLAHYLAEDPAADRSFGYVGPLKILEGRAAYIRKGIQENGGTFDADGRLAYSPAKDPFGLAASMHKVQLDDEIREYTKARKQAEEHIEGDPEADGEYREVEKRLSEIIDMQSGVQTPTSVVSSVHLRRSILKQKAT